jgi:hypothetical protein
MMQEGGAASLFSGIALLWVTAKLDAEGVQVDSKGIKVPHRGHEARATKEL